ncbi:glutamine synthetase family protein [Leptothoe sp. PORK10 BA2]|uniref:glutamine synthetase family protein n=1 Tax=Leptothoe sp. PORK10 BA2 TaxID=3110254 RepID=UPI002B1F8033|nr:glutamine synthetase family protein [Leptothoe sp. PORK10 BA2]MEA5465840.1 glutamine synthetase family protein [Leptothoe sp. PORK10 BA2]
MSHIPPSSEAVSAWVKTLQEQGVKYVRFELPDLHGVSRLKVIPINKVEGYARKGLNFYGGTLALDTASSVVSGSGYHEERKYCDMTLFPDIESCTPVPWMDSTVKVVCDAYWSATEPIQGAPRYVLQSLLDLAQQMGFEVMMGHEFEFYLLDAETHQPLFDGLHIFNHIRNQYVPEVTQMLDYLQAAGIDVITHNCEYAPSQFEINFGPGMGIKGADKAFTFKNAVKEIAHHLGYQASFMSKPFAGMAGCCCHFHISLWHPDGTNAFLDPSDVDGLSAVAKSFTQGILTHAPAMLPLIGPTPNCYRRLKPHTFAPSNISWGIEDRTAMVRMKATKDDQTHLEMRAASGLSNPYLSAAATLAAGLLGLKDNLVLQPMVDGPSEDDPSLKPFPKTLDAALDALAADGAMQALLGEEFCQLFSTVKAFELARFHDHITNWEVAEYLEIY